MSATSMPGFTAENSLFRSRIHNWRATTGLGNFANRNIILPQLGQSCGACTALTWPNERPTGVCVQACSEILADGTTINSFEQCACGGGGISVFRGGGLLSL